MSLSVRVIAPFGRDSELIVGVLQQHALPAVVSTVEEIVAKTERQEVFGPLLIAEEALNPAAVEKLSQYLYNQPSWSDLPILVLTGGGKETRRSSQLDAERLPLGSPVLLERPIRTSTLVSSVKAALRARTRQYEIRDVLSELAEERELLEAMLDSLPVGIVFAKASGQIVRGNRRLETIVRHPLLPTNMASHRQWVAFHPDGRQVDAHEFPLQRAIETGLSVPTEEYLYQRGDGTRAWVSLTASPVTSESGEVTGGVVVIADIDQQKRAEAALIQNEKLAAVGRLAASISHEINNPLEAVTNLLYLARQDKQISSQVKDFLDLADQELARVSQIVSHTLQFHRQATKPRVITVEKLLEPTLGLYTGRLINANIALEPQHKPTEPITCYDGEIRQVLNNLVGNAIESMKLGGRLLVRSHAATSWNTGAHGVRITIADTGHGMEAAVAARVFEAFYTTKGINGTGLGLWISKGIVDKHHGCIHVKSSTSLAHSGTVFTLFLPANPF